MAQGLPARKWWGWVSDSGLTSWPLHWVLWSCGSPTSSALEVREGFTEEAASQGAPRSSTKGSGATGRGKSTNLGWSHALQGGLGDGELQCAGAPEAGRGCWELCREGGAAPKSLERRAEEGCRAPGRAWGFKQTQHPVLLLAASWFGLFLIQHLNPAQPTQNARLSELETAPRRVATIPVPFFEAPPVSSCSSGEVSCLPGQPGCRI